ncbi:polysaccharide deacetylase family protein [Flavobacterium granuli]|uniref:Peptidoglycan/xylan/chitin deacetylase (PgdA/CDA1 family) n=1 Tax=Flavobacterium granuli TaxID=280093 RepID=A0A1M5MML7_9FLAO|nr:polysaccharide deacetylase family protein [Flavobacterium granuli]PRZ25004.1 peptidoglycan/xylan/chitin deacetylase (PgdA/CDA1 family) [Flavobacterium granuli]SHG78485.1 Peptidoglycan/xylan/chitin deacetylase, PgdA/CDA1 family [Flavobacterium granuli]
MSFYWIKTNTIIKRIFSNYIWDIPNRNNKIYLTFDDGPTPEITEWVLEKLDQHNAKATFFCIGKNIEAQPIIFKKIIEKGHAIGNHTFDHLNGWKTTTEDYLNNIILCEQSILNHKMDSKIFRPPYGKINSVQSKKLRRKGYKIIMWDVLSADFDQSITNEKCLENVVANIKPGSIIVFHDSQKAYNNLKYALPKVLDFIDKNNFSYEIIT